MNRSSPSQGKAISHLSGLSARKIIVISLAGIGNTLLFTPALRMLRKGFPSAHISALVMFKGAQEILEGNPHLNEIIHWNFIKEGPFRSLRFLSQLRSHKYDISINVYPANRREYNLISFLIGAKLRLAHRYEHRDSSSLGFFNNRRVGESNDRHDVEENVRLLGLLGVEVGSPQELEIFLTEEERRFAQDWLMKRDLEGDLKVGFHAGSARFKNQAQRRWPKEKFIRLGKILAQKYNAKILIFGGPDELQTNQEISDALGRMAYLVREVSVKQTATLMERCNLFVTNDSGLMHIAAALNLPTVAIFGPTNPVWVHPWKAPYEIVRKDLPCSPCFFYSVKPLACRYGDFRCIRSIDVEDVLAGIERIMGRSQNGRS